MFRIYKYRRQFNAILKSSRGSWTKTGFLRLFLFSVLILVAIFSLQTFVFYSNMVAMIPQWHPFSWSYVHGKQWNTVQLMMPSSLVLFNCWVAIAGGLIVFIFTGLGRDATGMYRKALSCLGVDRCFTRCKSTILPLSQTFPIKRSTSTEATLVNDSLKYPTPRYVFLQCIYLQIF